MCDSGTLLTVSYSKNLIIISPHIVPSSNGRRLDVLRVYVERVLDLLDLVVADGDDGVAEVVAAALQVLQEGLAEGLAEGVRCCRSGY